MPLTRDGTSPEPSVVYSLECLALALNAQQPESLQVTADPLCRSPLHRHAVKTCVIVYIIRAQHAYSIWQAYAGKPDPKFYYEPVEPSDWQPPRPDTCLELYRKAYCSQADVAFPLLFWASLVGLCYSAALPLWGIVLVALPYFVGGTQLFIVKGRHSLLFNLLSACLIHPKPPSPLAPPAKHYLLMLFMALVHTCCWRCRYER